MRWPSSVVVLSAFYAVVGIMFLLTSGGVLMNVAILGILNTMTAYAIFQKKSWAVWLSVVSLFFGTLFGIITTYNAIIWFDTALHPIPLLLILYLILAWFMSIYLIEKRDKLLK